MNAILYKLLGRASGLADVEPLIALFLGAALLAVFLTALFTSPPANESPTGTGLLWALYRHTARLLWALMLVSLLVATVTVMRTYLRQTVANFQRSHGRVTEANYNAVQTIWGAEQQQPELNVNMYHDEETTERIESEDLTKPAVLRKKMVRQYVTGNPFISAHHDVTLRQNPRRKGSALYGGYETDCVFTWKLKNPSTNNQIGCFTFPLPAASAMYDGLTATLDGKDVLSQMEIRDGSLVLQRAVAADETLDLHVAFKSRGLSYWYFQVKEAREIRDFTLTLNLPDLPKAKLNYPEGCMTPTEILPNPNGEGSVLAYRFDHALTDKGMGISIPQLPQPGEITRAVLEETEHAWLLIFSMLSLCLTLASVRHAVIITTVFAVATAFAYGLVADFSDLLLGFWGTGALVLLPLFLLLAFILKRAVPGIGGTLAWLLLGFGIVYPCLAGLDYQRQSLYLNLAAFALLALTAWQLAKRLATNDPVIQPVVQVKPGSGAIA